MNNSKETIMLEPCWVYSEAHDPDKMPRILDYHNVESLAKKMGYSQSEVSPYLAGLAIALREWHEKTYGCMPLVQDWEFWIDEAPEGAEDVYEQDLCYARHPDVCTALSPMWIAVYRLDRETCGFVRDWLAGRAIA